MRLPSRLPSFGFGLSGRLLGLTVLFVMLAEVLIYVPSIANFRLGWLDDRIAQAKTAALLLDAAPAGAVPEPLARQVLASIGAQSVALKAEETRRLLAQADVPASVAVDVDMRDPGRLQAIIDAFDTLLAPPHRMIRVVGQAPLGEEFVEIVLDETPLQHAMLTFSRNILLVSLLISAITAVLLYLSLVRLIIRPVQTLTNRMVAFGQKPEDESRIVEPSGRHDEIGVAERELAVMQREIHNQLQQKSRLAALGLAVSKISHDLRNLLGSAQLILERIGGSSDPTIERWAPKLMAALDRATALAESTLSYGKAQEPAPNRRTVAVSDVVADVREALGVPLETKVGWVEALDRDLKIDADPDQLFRVLLNICRNAIQALQGRGELNPLRDQIRITGRREGGVVMVEVADTGPGVPEQARKHLFEPFQGSVRRGGVGLGLAIACDLVRAHGGAIELVEGTLGATFRITIPDRPVQFPRARDETRKRA